MTEMILKVPGGPEGGPMGWVVIDSNVNGRSHGGLRISKHVSESELVVLARRMTLKFGFLGIANGGAKAGILGDPEAPADVRHALLRKFASSIQELVKSRRYLPHADMGTTELEILEIFGNSSARNLPSRDESGFYTSIGVSTAARVAVRQAGKKIDQMSVSVEGFGKVGSSVAKLLAEAGAKIVGVSTSCGLLYRKDGLPVDDLIARSRKEGSEFVRQYREAEQIPLHDLFSLPVDLLCPCANSGSIHVENAPSVQAGIVCPGANAPVTPEAEAILNSRGIRVLPDFLTNSGGVLGGTMAFAGIPLRKIRPIMSEMLESRFTTLFEMNAQEVERYCMDRFERTKAAAESGGLRQIVFDAGLSLYRTGLIPGFVVSKLATRYFQTR